MESFKRKRWTISRLRSQNATKALLQNANELPRKKVILSFSFFIPGKPYIAEDGLYILEALAASGLRSIRYWNEIPNIRRIIINDIADAAVESMKDNLSFNGITSERVVPNQGFYLLQLLSLGMRPW